MRLQNKPVYEISSKSDNRKVVKFRVRGILKKRLWPRRRNRSTRQKATFRELVTFFLRGISTWVLE